MRECGIHQATEPRQEQRAPSGEHATHIAPRAPLEFENDALLPIQDSTPTYQRTEEKPRAVFCLSRSCLPYENNRVSATLFQRHAGTLARRHRESAKRKDNAHRALFVRVGPAVMARALPLAFALITAPRVVSAAETPQAHATSRPSVENMSSHEQGARPGIGARADGLREACGRSFGQFRRALPWVVFAGLGVLCWWEELAGRWDLLAEGEVRAAAVTWRAPRIVDVDAELVALADVAPLRLVRLTGGEFMMGSPQSEAGRDDDERLHRARVGAFAIGIHEVTLAQWQAVMQTRPNDCEYGCEDEHPVANVSWNDACRFSIALTGRENARRRNHGAELLTPCYRADGDSCAWPKAQRKCTGFRLPTEAEWEYAARADSRTDYFFGDDRTKLCTYGNVADETAARENSGWPAGLCDDGYAGLAPVGSFRANAWGLYDVHGNAWELVWDWYADYPENRDKVRHGYSGPGNGRVRVLRGGSFLDTSRGLRAAYRSKLRPSSETPGDGFRVVRVAKSYILPENVGTESQSI